MTKRAYDPEFAALLPLLPTVQDLSSVEQVRAARDMRGMLLPAPPARTDVTMADRLVPGLAGAPQVPWISSTHARGASTGAFGV